jgi:hypothetical protein
MRFKASRKVTIRAVVLRTSRDQPDWDGHITPRTGIFTTQSPSAFYEKAELCQGTLLGLLFVP